MDEVENPDLPAAGESSPTLRPIDQDDGDDDEGKPGIDTAEAENLLVDSANPSPLAHPTIPAQRASIPTRPGLTREGSVPPPQQPPPAPPVGDDNSGSSDGSGNGNGNGSGSSTFDFPSDPPDSLTLADLQRLRQTFPSAPAQPKEALRAADRVYDFETTTDAQSLPVEVEEWFTYAEVEEVRLRRCRALFGRVWGAEGRDGEGERGRGWVDVEGRVRRAFVGREVQGIRAGLEEEVAVWAGGVTTGLMVLAYVALGAWEETAGRACEGGQELEEMFVDGRMAGMRLGEYERSGLQIQWVVSMVNMLHECGGLQVIYDCLRRVCDESFAASPGDAQPSRNGAEPRRGEETMELWCCLTLMYLFVEVARTTATPQGRALKQDILALQPKLLNYLTQLVARLRWDDSAPVPLTKILLLAWKTILVTLGGLADVEALKTSLRSPEEQEEKDKRTGQPIITASPLDYHLFRQEIQSKYPAYQPPENVLELEPEGNSMLPPLKHRQPSLASFSVSHQFPGVSGTAGGSIMHAPIHIATPAPSPPPSPAGPGKAGKKQNYQTNNLFPFLYPPLDERSGDLGGRGSTALQDQLVGRRWEGSSVPVAVAEAAELFRGRCRATRSMRQMWEAGRGFVVWERRWKTDEGGGEDEDVDVDGFELVEKPEAADEKTAAQGEPEKEKSEVDKKVEAIGEYYRESLPHLQSVVVVLMRAAMAHVTDLNARNSAQNGGGGGGLQAGIQFAEPNGNGLPNGTAHRNGAGDGIENSADEIDHLRSQEIQAKALTGILLLLLKWFKVGHVLQYEYLTQLLLDSNYVPMVLKLLGAQDLGRAVHYRLDGEERGFWGVCRGSMPTGMGEVGAESGVNGTMFEESEEDEAAPPDIKRSRGMESEEAVSPTSHLRDLSPQSSGGTSTHPPEVDDLGYPLTPLPKSPITTYSWRNLFASTNYLRILQKITRRKTHRALLLVSYKSTGFFRRSLRIP
ncbi:Factor arrest protein 11, partial [Teratosphaeriaceae sp. CCFEE 6253]